MAKAFIANSLQEGLFSRDTSHKHCKEIIVNTGENLLITEITMSSDTGWDYVLALVPTLNFY